MVLKNSVISFSLVLGFCLLGLGLPEKTSNNEEIFLGIVGVCLYAIASVLTFKALKAWLVNIKQKNYNSVYQSLEIMPSLPIVLIWCFLLVAIIAIPFGI